MSKPNSTAAGTSVDAAKAEQASAQLKDTAPCRPINDQIVQNVLLIWLDNNIDDSSADCHNIIAQLRRYVNTVNTFTDADQCIDFLTDIYNESVCMIISDAASQNIVPLIYDVVQLHSVFISCANKTEQEEWTKKWSKIKGVFTEISPICEALKQSAQECEQNAISMSFVATGGDNSKKNLDQLDSSFMYTQILKEILLGIKFEPKHFIQFIDYCRRVFADNQRVLENVDKLQREYSNKTPVWWYTFECSLYSMLNRSLRLMNTDIIIKIGFFICDLHRHIQELHRQQFSGQDICNSFTVYRGQGMSETDFDQMTKTKGGLMSFNNFLSTSKKYDVSFMFAEGNSYNRDLVGIFFVMTIDPAKSTTPFASIVNVSSFGDDEDEVLFAMHTVFRIHDITPMSGNDRLFQVDLILTSDNDEDLRQLTDQIREETFPDNEGWYRLGLVLLKMGQPDKAEEVYEILLGQEKDEGKKAPIYGQLGSIKYNQGKYKEAITFYEKVLEIQQQSLPSNHPDLAIFYNNIGSVYDDIGEYSKALSSHKKALEIRKKSLPSNHPDLASSYNNVGSLYDNTGEYAKALSSYEKALEIYQKTLPPNHPDLASSCNNIGNVYSHMGEYSKALSSHEKAHGIYQKTLPPNHPTLAISYNNIGMAYSNMGEYSKALSSHEKALAIRQESLSPNHPDLAMSYNNIGMVYFNMGEYSKALLFHEKALAIRQQSLPSNHPDLGSTYNNIGLVYFKTGDYSKALLSHEKALGIRQKSFPPKHLDLAASCNNIGAVYSNMGEYSRALSYYEKALAIQQQSLSANHPDLGSTYNNIGSSYGQTGKYAEALPYFEKALQIQQQSLPPNHPVLATFYNNIGSLYGQISKHAKALPYFEKALEIRQNSLPLNHPDLAISYYNIGLMYENMGKYSNACSFYERAVDIGQQSLPTNHLRLHIYRRNLEDVKKKL